MGKTESMGHPRLLFNGEGIEGFKARVARYEWVNALWAKKLGGLDQALEDILELPPRGGGWWHWYASPKTGAPLRTGKQIGKWEWEHIDPVTGDVYTGGDPSDPSRDYDACIIMGLHDGWAKKVRDLGLAYQVTGEVRYAQKAREILLAYADRYLKYDLHTTRNEARIGGGRVGPQTLDESVWLIPFSQGADMVWETLSGDDRTALAEKLLLPAARDVILVHEMRVHNIQCWKNSAVGSVGFLLDDTELIAQAIDHPDRGYRKQMADGVMPDGAWWEGAWGYHFYTLSALWGLVEAAQNCGVDLYGDAFRSMFDAPLRFAMPDLRLPAFNDSGEVRLEGRASIYELAYARYRNPDYAVLLANGNRADDFALWFGEGELPSTAARAWESTNYPGSGYGILAKGKGRDATWACLKYGPHGGGHGHPDKLNVVVYARGEVLAVDPGTSRYGLSIRSGWYKATPAHNTLVVDETSQEASEGRCVAFGSLGGVDYAVAGAGAIYEGVDFTRTAALVDENLLVFVDQVRCDRERTLDVIYHQRGTWAELPEGSAWAVPDKDGYSYLKDATVREAEVGLRLGIQVKEGWRSAVILAGGEPTEAVTCTGVGDNLEDRVPEVIFRRRCAETAFAWCVCLDDGSVEMAWLPVADASGNAVARSVAAALQVTSGGEMRVLSANPQGQPLCISLPDGTTWETLAVFDVR